MNIFKKYIDDGLISVQSHPERQHIKIYNYTHDCQYSRAWDDVTMTARGLIIDTDTGEVLARPFKKFFNLDELHSLGMSVPNETPHIFEKYDGSLGISYILDDKAYIATRGSFTSEQALFATEWLHKHKDLHDYILAHPDYTFLFEIIYPENRIVVDYGDFRGMVYLASVHRQTGKTTYHTPPVDIAKKHKEIKKHRENAEGYVLHYPKSDFRVKIKHDEYVRLHRIVTGISPKRIWEELYANGIDTSIIASIPDIPDEIFKEIDEIEQKLRKEYRHIENTARQCVAMIQGKDRKEQAKYIKQNCGDISGVVFAMLDGKDYNEIIFRKIKNSV